MASWLKKMNKKRLSRRSRRMQRSEALEVLNSAETSLSRLISDARAASGAFDMSHSMSEDLRSAIVANWRAARTDWPMTRRPSINLTKNADLPVPELTNQQRVQGKNNRIITEESTQFVDSGIVDLTVVFNIAEVMGITFDEATRVFDWGVGCARMGRHMPPMLQENFTGADVDPINIEWSRANIPFGRYEVLDPYGPAPFEDNSFDFVYSHSVLTHLSEKDQDHWLRELSRITEGLMVLSVHGPYSNSNFQWAENPAAVYNFLNLGFVNSPLPNPDIADVTDPEYYRDVGHSPAYIREHWSQFVDVVEIIPRGFGTLHDAVVCRPKS